MAESPELSLRHLLGDEYHPLQPKLILAKEFEIAAVGGMGAGKTYAACVAAFRHAAKWPGARVLIARFTYEEMVKSTKWAFFEFVKNKGLVKHFVRPKEWDYREGTHYCRLTNGSEILFSNLDKSLNKHKNVEYSYVFIDQLEEIDFDVYQILMLRCRLTICPSTERHVVGVANDEGDNWIRNRFKTYDLPHGRPDAQLGRLLIQGTTLENPHLDEATKRSYLLLPAELQKRWVFALMEGGTSRLLPPLTIVEPFTVPRHWPRWLGVDPARSEGVTCGEYATANPDKVAYRGVLPNAVHFYDEYWGEHRDVEDHAAELLKRRGPHHFRAQIMDQTAWATAMKSKFKGTLSIADLYMNAGLMVSPSVGDEWTRVSRFIEAHKRGLTVSKQCEHLIAMAPRYRVRGQTIADPMSPTGQKALKIVAKSKYHPVDAGGYALAMIPSRVTGVEIREIRDAIDIAPDVDEHSRRHWEEMNRHLPKRRGRESIVTQGFDEAEFHRDDTEDDGLNHMRREEDGLW